MKVKIGKYKDWIGPYQIAEALCFWAKPVKGSYGSLDTPDFVHNFGEFLAGSDEKDNLLTKLCNWIYSKRQRSIKVHIDDHDVWGMDHTLAFIIVPMLKKLKVKKHGAPYVDDVDVPLELRSTSAPAKENDWDTDDNHFKRWDWVLDEMIWAFENIIDESWEDQFHSGVINHQWKKVKDTSFSELYSGDKHTHIFDREGYTKYSLRIEQGTKLFGKYYRGLWA